MRFIWLLIETEAIKVESEPVETVAELISILPAGRRRFVGARSSKETEALTARTSLCSN